MSIHKPLTVTLCEIHVFFISRCTGSTNHAEVGRPNLLQRRSTHFVCLQVVHFEYDPTLVSYDKLLDYFWRFHDPTTLNRQGNDQGTQYRSVVYFYNEEQEALAQKMKLELAGKFSQPITTEISSAPHFYTAEEYHQEYLDKNPGGYCNRKFETMSFQSHVGCHFMNNLSDRPRPRW